MVSVELIVTVLPLAVVTLAPSKTPPVPPASTIFPVEALPKAALVTSEPAALLCANPSVKSAAFKVRSPPLVLIGAVTVKFLPANSVTEVPAIWLVNDSAALTVRFWLASIVNDPVRTVNADALTVIFVF